MIAIIRIKGMVRVRKDLAETLYRLRLRRKYACVVLENPTQVQLGMLKKIKDFVAYGGIDEKMHKKLNESRKTNIENFYRLHPPRGGFKGVGDNAPTKTHYPKGILGDNGKEISKLIGKMI